MKAKTKKTEEREVIYNHNVDKIVSMQRNKMHVCIRNIS